MPTLKRRTRKKKKSAAVRTTSKKTTTKQEIGLLGRALRGLGGLGGGAIGGLIGMPQAGAAVGHDFGAAVSRWLGAGDYTTSQNSILARASQGIPAMHKNNQSVTVRHKEYICSINGSTNFTVQRELTINPGLEATFPWLAPIARCFQEWELKGAVFHYVPTSGTAISSTNSSLGAVMMQTTYRAGDTAPTSKVELLNEYWASESVPYEAFIHPLECDPRENPFNVHYVRSGSEGVVEPLLYDLGTTFICTQGMQSDNVVGDIWLTYEVELKKPLITSAVTASPLCLGALYSTVTDSDFFSGSKVTLIGNLPVTATARTVTLPIGTSGVFLFMCAARADPNFRSPASPNNFYWNAAPVLSNLVENTVLMGGSRVYQQFANADGNTVVVGADYITVATKADVSVPATFEFPAIGNLGANPLASMTLYVVKLAA
jgi:hypothetical protein